MVICRCCDIICYFSSLVRSTGGVRKPFCRAPLSTEGCNIPELAKCADGVCRAAGYMYVVYTFPFSPKNP